MKKRVGMKALVGGAVLAVGLAILVVLVIAETALATPGAGVVSHTFAVGTFPEIEANTETQGHEIELRAKGNTDVHILQNRIVPGGTFGWHSHPGPSIVVVQSDALTLYRGDDPACAPQVFAAGAGFVDHGGDVPVVRNEGSVDAVVYVTSFVPHSAPRRIDAP